MAHTPYWPARQGTGSRGARDSRASSAIFQAVCISRWESPPRYRARARASRGARAMPFAFQPMDTAHAHTILTWRYDPPYNIYDIAPPPNAVAEVVQFFVDPRNMYYQIEGERGDFVAFCCFGWDAQVAGGDYSAEALDVGLGVRPDLTGQ